MGARKEVRGRDLARRENALARLASVSPFSLPPPCCLPQHGLEKHPWAQVPSKHLRKRDYRLVTGGRWAMTKASFTLAGLRAAKAREQSSAIAGARDGSLQCRNGGLPKHEGPDLPARDAAGNGNIAIAQQRDE